MIKIMKTKQIIKFVGKCILIYIICMIPTLLFLLGNGSRIMNGLAVGFIFLCPAIGMILFNDKNK